jgi:hypothetical protein
MIDIDKLIETLNIPDGMTVDEMRKVVVDVLDVVRASNDAEKLISDENESLKSENDRLSKQNLELFNRVTSSLGSTLPEASEPKEEEEEITTDDILEYYN